MTSYIGIARPIAAIEARQRLARRASSFPEPGGTVMPYTQIIDTCAHCGRRVTVPLASVTINYHRTDEARDRYHWSHGDCSLTVRPYTASIATLLEPVCDQRSCKVSFIDAEYDDPARANSVTINRADEVAIVRDIERGP